MSVIEEEFIVKLHACMWNAYIACGCCNLKKKYWKITLLWHLWTTQTHHMFRFDAHCERKLSHSSQILSMMIEIKIEQR